MPSSSAPRKVSDAKPILLIRPNVTEQTESKGSRHKAAAVVVGSNSLAAPNAADSVRKKSLIDSGLEMLFKKSSPSSSAKNHHHQHHTDTKIRPEVVLDSNNHHHHQQQRRPSGGDRHLNTDEKRHWKPFDTIKIYTDRRKSHDGGTTTTAGDRRSKLYI